MNATLSAVWNFLLSLAWQVGSILNSNRVVILVVIFFLALVALPYFTFNAGSDERHQLLMILEEAHAECLSRQYISYRYKDGRTFCGRPDSDTDIVEIFYVSKYTDSQ